jgi:hypothetical protein
VYTESLSTISEGTTGGVGKQLGENTEKHAKISEVLRKYNIKTYIFYLFLQK